MVHVMPGNAQALSVEATASRTSPAVMQKHTLYTLIIQESVSMKGIQVSLIIYRPLIQCMITGYQVRGHVRMSEAQKGVRK